MYLGFWRFVLFCFVFPPLILAIILRFLNPQYACHVEVKYLNSNNNVEFTFNHGVKISQIHGTYEAINSSHCGEFLWRSVVLDYMGSHFVGFLDTIPCGNVR